MFGDLLLVFRIRQCQKRPIHSQRDETQSNCSLSDRFFIKAYTTCSIIFWSFCDSIKRKLIGLVCHVSELKRNLRPSALRLPVKDTAGAKGCASSTDLISVVPVSQLPYAQQSYSRKVKFADATLSASKILAHTHR